MQATRPISTSNPARAGMLTVVVAAIIIVVSAAVATIAPTLGPNAGAGAGTTIDTPPLVLDPDARNGGGWKQPGPGVPQ